MRKEDSYQQGERVIYVERNNVVAVEVTGNCCSKRKISYRLKTIESLQGDTFKPKSGELFTFMRARRTNSSSPRIEGV